MRAATRGPDREWDRTHSNRRGRLGIAALILLSAWLAPAVSLAVPLSPGEEAIAIPYEPPRQPAPASEADAVPEFVAWLEYLSPPVVDPGPARVAQMPVQRLKPGADQVIQALDAKSLAEKFDGIGYRLAAVRQGAVHVPRVFVDEMPRDMRAVESPDLRKRLFIRAMLPLILRANEEVRREREQLQKIMQRIKRGLPLGLGDAEFIDEMRLIYADETCSLDELLRRVDVVPPSLALAQAAEESGWGTSRFVREGNAVFGQRSFKGDGLVPLRREHDKTHRVRNFSHVQASVAAYLFNLNTHQAYGEFRKLRARMRARGETLDSAELVASLDRYSERGKAYIATIRTILRVNDMTQFDAVELSPYNRAVPRRAYDIQPVRWSF